MKMQKKQFRIGELAKNLGVEKFVIRFWEKEFRLNAYRSDGGQRFYQEKDVEKFKLIKQLLYDQGFTIAGAKKKILDKAGQKDTMFASARTTIEAAHKKAPDAYATCNHLEFLQKMRSELVALKKIL